MVSIRVNINAHIVVNLINTVDVIGCNKGYVLVMEGRKMDIILLSC